MVVLSTTLCQESWRSHIEFVATHSFETSAKKLLTEEDRRELELFLLEDPRRGQLIERTGGFREVRFARAEENELRKLARALEEEQ